MSTFSDVEGVWSKQLGSLRNAPAGTPESRLAEAAYTALTLG